MPIDAITAVNAIWGAGTAEDLLSITTNSGGNDAAAAAKLSIGAMEREVKRIRGHKLRLTPADNERLSKLQEKITLIEKRTSDGTVRADELATRTELFLEADRILGKPSAGIETDDTLTALNVAIDDLLQPKLNRVQSRRLERLEILRNSLTDQLDRDSSSVSARNQFKNVARQISELTPSRQIHELSVAERREYDSYVEQVNEHVKVKLELNSTEAIRVYNLQSSIDQLRSSLPPDPAGQPTSAAVARAYGRLG